MPITAHTLPALLHSLTEPFPAIPEADRSRARLLAWLQLALLALAAVALPTIWFTEGKVTPAAVAFSLLITVVLVTLALAFRLSRAGHHQASAWLTIGVMTLAPWLSVGLDTSVAGSNLVALAFSVAPIFLAGILLSARAAALLTAIQLAILLLLPVIHPASITADFSSAVMFVVFMSALSIIAALISEQDRTQIAAKTSQLSLSEARLREQSVRDALTGVFNRRYLEETLARELLRATRLQGPLGVLILDVDHFKHINDTYGHAVGDDVLRELGGLLNASVRGSDIVCRYGGEEFVLLLPEASLEITRQRAELIRAGAGCITVNHLGLPTVPITLSVGVAVFPDHGLDANALLKSVDDALYRAKREGRDRTALSTSPGVYLGLGH